MRELHIDDAKDQLADLIEAVLGGETIFIRTDEDHAVQLTPARRGKGKPTFGSGKGLFTIADDFDTPLEDFETSIK